MRAMLEAAGTPLSKLVVQQREVNWQMYGPIYQHGNHDNFPLIQY
jgi:hypothetical protein